MGNESATGRVLLGSPSTEQVPMSRKAPPPRRSRLFTFPSGPLLLDEPPHSPDNKLPMYHGPLVPVSEPPRP